MMVQFYRSPGPAKLLAQVLENKYKWVNLSELGPADSGPSEPYNLT